MRFEDYVAARRGRLIDHAADLGLPAPDAPDLVDAVLAGQRRRIERLADPDVELYDAVAHAVDSARRGPSPPPRVARLGATGRAVVLLVLVLVGGLLGAGWWLLRPPEQVRMPSLVGLGPDDVATRLAATGLGARDDAVPSCEPRGLVVASDPAAGTLVDVGSSVRLLRAARTARTCGGAPARRDRAAAWAFVGFVNGGRPPAFDDTVYVVLDGREPAVLPTAAVTDPERWAGIRAVSRGLAALTRRSPAYPRLQVDTGPPPPRTCGVRRPAAAGARPTLRLRLQPGGSGGAGGSADQACPLTVDLYRDRTGVIDAVVVYSGAEP